jgi:hypothetical protein
VLAGAPLVGPTSLNRGEGLLAGLTCEVGGGEDEGDCGGEREDEQTSTVMRLMFHLNSAHRTKIAFDIHAG